MSPVTREQVRRAYSYTQVRLLAGSLLHNPAYADERLARIGLLLDEGRHVLAYVAGDAIETKQPVRPGEMAAATAAIVRRVVHRQASRNPLRRMGIAGGGRSAERRGGKEW